MFTFAYIYIEYNYIYICMFAYVCIHLHPQSMLLFAISEDDQLFIDFADIHDPIQCL